MFLEQKCLNRDVSRIEMFKSGCFWNKNGSRVEMFQIEGVSRIEMVP